MSEVEKNKLNQSDEGELNIELHIYKNRVILDFDKPISWIGLKKKEAISLANGLIENSKEIKDLDDESVKGATE